MIKKYGFKLFLVFYLVASAPANAQIFIPVGFYTLFGGAVTISNGPIFNFGIIPINTTVDKTLYINNASELASYLMQSNNLTQPQFTYKGGAYPGTGGTCTSSLQRGNTCTLVLTAQSNVATATVSDTLKVSFNTTTGAASTTRQIQAQFTSTTISSIFINPNSGNFNIGNTQQLRCYGITSDGGVVDLTGACAWSTTNSLVVDVNNTTAKGLITANGTGAVTISANYMAATATAAITVNGAAPSFVDNGLGLHARYLKTTSQLAQPEDPYSVLQNSRIDAIVDFNFGAGNNPAGGADYFGGRWTGQIRAPTTGSYCLQIRTDDGGRLWVNNTLIINSWVDQGPTNTNGTFSFVANQKYDIFMEYYERGGGSEARLRYQAGACPGAATNLPTVAQNNLFPNATRALDIKNLVVPRYSTNMVRGYTMNGTAGASIANAAVITGLSGTTGALNGTASNANGTGMQYEASERTTGIAFDGIDDYFSVLATTYPTGGATRTISAWVQPEPTGTTNSFFTYGNATAGNHIILEVTADSKAQLNTTTATCTSNKNLNLNAWNMITATINGTTAKIYIDGQLDRTCTITAPTTSVGSTAYFGRNSVSGTLFKGSLDDFAFWNLELTAGEINTFYERQQVINP